MEEQGAIELLRNNAFAALPPARQTPNNIELLNSFTPIDLINVVRKDKDLRRNNELQEQASRIEFHFHGDVIINNYYYNEPYRANNSFDYSAYNPSNYIFPNNQERPININVEVNPNFNVSSDSRSRSSQDGANNGIALIGMFFIALLFALALSSK